MPSVRVASHDHSLRLDITHNLVHGPDPVHTRLPKHLDVLWLSDVSIVLDGALDGRPIPARDLARSGLALHLYMQFRANADRLGLNNVSRPFVDDADGLAKLMLTPSRPLPHPSRPHANLVSLHLAYIWKTNDVASGRLIPEADPFSPTLFLPAEALLTRATEQFLIYHVVRRYPLVFGPWSKRLDLETQYFPSIGHSIVDIMSRSRNRQFASRCRRLIKIARNQHKFVIQTSAAAIASCTGHAAANPSKEETDNLVATPVLTDERVLCECLEQLFRIRVPQRRFKPAGTPQFVPSPRDDDDSFLLPLIDQGIDQEDDWVELPEITMSSPALLMLPEDVDIFAGEDDREDEMWRLDAADTGHGESESGGPSGGSLISASISTTDSRPAFTSTLYPNQQPGASGLPCKVSLLALLEDPETPTLMANLTRSVSDAPHDHGYSTNYEQDMGTCQEGGDSWSEDGWALSEEGSDGAELTEMLLV